MTSLLRPLLVLSLATLVLTQEYLIIPNSQSSHHVNTACFTLDQLAQTNLTNEANLTLIFRPGEHTLTQLLSIHNFTHVQMIAQNNPVLTLHDSGWIELSDINQLSIEGLTFNGLTSDNSKALIGHLSVRKIHSAFFSTCRFSGLGTKHISVIELVSLVKVVVEDAAFDGNNGTALNISEAGTVSVDNSTFTGNQGGAVYIDSQSVNSTVNINNSIFADNSASHLGGAIYVATGEVYIINSVLKRNRLSEGWYGGGIALVSSTATIYYSTLVGNIAAYGGGIFVYLSSVSVYNSVIADNTADYDAGGIYMYLGNMSIYNSSLEGNTANGNGGGIYVASGRASIHSSDLIVNTASSAGGGIFLVSGTASVCNSSLKANTADVVGGGICVESDSAASVYNSVIENNTGAFGGGIFLDNSGSVSIQNSGLNGNTAVSFGGGICADSGNSAITISKSTLTDNSAYKGSILYATLSAVVTVNDTCIVYNTAETIGVYISQSTLTFWGDNTFSNNNGSIYAVNSQVYFNGQTAMDNNYEISGGAIECAQSTVYFNCAVKISKNTATKNGGGVLLRETSLYVNSPVTISQNTANEGGAIYAYQSTITFDNTGHDASMVANNIATNNGGGIHATALIIKISNSSVNVLSNTAEANGGGLFLQQNSKLYIQKQEKELWKEADLKVRLTVSNNHALLGGGIYVNDNTSTGDACNSQPIDTGFFNTHFIGECFIQTIKLYDSDDINKTPSTVNTFITHNTADQSGSAIYGGLLDRCTASQLAELRNKYPRIHPSNGLGYLNSTVELPTDEYSISSDPLQVKLCDVSHSNVRLVRKGQLFQLYVKALDQAGNPVNATIHSAVVTRSGVGRLKEGQVEQSIGQECTELKYNVFSEDSSAQMELYAIGPCTNLGISRLLITIAFLNCTCPCGFHPSQSNIECSCECDPELHATECFPEDNTFQPGNMLWVGAKDFNDTGYLVHDCPFDYCIDQPVNISLNSSQQIDRQCAYNRSGVLCGECNGGFSLVFATSKCQKCSNIYLLLLIPVTVAGIALVVFILSLNITIATGTIHGMILYANVLAANKAIFMPFRAPNFLTVFVSWINLDLGIETCFYNGMNSQAKVLLQLAFPGYLFILVFLIIVLSKYANSFAKLLSNRNPVAALCTLLILSYSKLLRLIITALQFTSLQSSDNSIVWLYDGNIQYFSTSHIPRFVAAAVILTACVLFTTLLFFGQWFPRCSKWKVMKWTKNTKYSGFMDAFHAPFTPKHRYWLGLLLFALIAHNLAASMAPDTSVPVLSAGCITVGLIVYKSLMSRVYRNRLNNALETLFLLNIIVLSLGTYHFKGNVTGQHALACVSMAFAFILFVVIICYHFYKYLLKKTNVWNNQVRPFNPAALRINFKFHKNQNYQRLAEMDDNVDVELPAAVDMYSYGQGPKEETDPDKYITPPIIRPATRPDQLREPDLDILAPITEEDYRQHPIIPQDENRSRPVVTSTVVEIN